MTTGQGGKDHAADPRNRAKPHDPDEIQDSGFAVWGLGVKGLGFRVYPGSRTRPCGPVEIQNFGFTVYGSGSRVEKGWGLPIPRR